MDKRSQRRLTEDITCYGEHAAYDQYERVESRITLGGAVERGGGLVGGGAGGWLFEWVMESRMCKLKRVWIGPGDIETGRSGWRSAAWRGVAQRWRHGKATSGEETSARYQNA
jgi:hypothetical protein